MSLAWLTDAERRDLGYWTAALWSAAVGLTLLTLRGLAPEWLVVGIGNGLCLASLALFWAGLRTFDGKASPLVLPAGAPFAIWMVLYLSVPALTQSVNLRIMVLSAVIAVYSFAIAQAAWCGARGGPFRARRLMAVLFGSHALAHLARIPLALLFPVTLQADGQIVSEWHSVHTFVAYLQVLLVGMALFTLVRLRREDRYRVESETDDLTSVLNRRAFMREVASALSKRRPGALALLDLDHFKRVNDTYGHPAGDAVLRAFARRVGEGLPAEALFGRIGGEEFAIWLPDSDAQAALAHCEAIRLRVEQLAVEAAGALIRPTVSIGLCTGAQEGASADLAIAIADHALYLSKRQGRNRSNAIAFNESLDVVRRSLAGSPADGSSLPRADTRSG